MKINLDNFESVKYKVTDDISIEIVIENDELKINTINKTNTDEKFKERFNQLCGTSPCKQQYTDVEKDIWKKKIQSILEKKSSSDKQNKKEEKQLVQSVSEKAKENFSIICQKSDDIIKQRQKEFPTNAFKKIGYLDRRIEECGTKSDSRVQDIEAMMKAHTMSNIIVKP